jgi:hypothetical protein
MWWTAKYGMEVIFTAIPACCIKPLQTEGAGVVLSTSRYGLKVPGFESRLEYKLY